MKYGNRIYELRKKYGFSQENIADKLNVTRQSVSLWETDQASPSIDNIVALCELFDISVDAFIKNDILNTEKDDESNFSVNYKETFKILYTTKYYKTLFIYFYLSVLGTLFIIQEFVIEHHMLKEIFDNPITLMFSIVFILFLILVPIIFYRQVKNRLDDRNEFTIDFHKTKIFVGVNGDRRKESFTIFYDKIKYISEKSDCFILVTEEMTLYLPKGSTYGKAYDSFRERDIKIISQRSFISSFSFTKVMCITLTILSILSFMLTAVFVTDDNDLILWIIFTLLPVSAIAVGIYAKRLVSKWYYITTIVFGIIFLLFSLMALIAVFLA